MEKLIREETEQILQMIERHRANGTVPHPPTWPIDRGYAAQYSAITTALATGSIR